MNSLNRSTKLKVAFGYIVLIALLIVSVGYIYRKMQSLTNGDDDTALFSQRRHVTNLIISQLYQAEVIGQSLSTGQLSQYPRYQVTMQQAKEAVDSLRVLLEDSIQLARLDTVEILFREKVKNMRNLLEVLQDGGTDQIYSEQIDRLIAEQDSLLNLPRVQKRVVTHTNSYVIHKKPKSFFKRVGEVFAPGKTDSTEVSNVIQEEITDTITEAYNPADTVATLLKDIQNRVTDTHQERLERVNRRTYSLRLSGLRLSQQVNQLLSTIEEEEQALAQSRHTQQELVRQSSIRTVARIAVAAVVLAICFLVLIWRDITRSNHYRKELEKAKLRAEDLLAAREKLMLTITHDIKAPAGSILGYADLLERLTTEKRQRVYLENMQSSARHLLALVHSLLDYHRLDAHKMEINRVVFNPYQLFDAIQVSFKPLAAAKQLDLNYTCSQVLDRGYIGDPFRIRQIAENLLSNALKFTRQGHIGLQVEWEEGRLHFRVDDTGCGIRPEEQEHIFREFTRLHEAQGQEGFGLGLAITRKLVLLLEGEIRLESRPGEGSTFHVYLPLPEGPASHTLSLVTDKEPETPCPAVDPPLHLALIDDDRIQLRLTAALLERPGVTVVCCEHPDTLFEQLQTEHFDALLTDIQMPAMNGFDLLKKIRAWNLPAAQSLPVIALTARSDMDESYLRSQGFAGCVHKPFTANELFAVVFRAVGNEAPVSCTSSIPNTPLADNEALDFSSLAAFAADDPEATAEILRTFIDETGKNHELLAKALSDGDMPSLTALAHKMLPLFTLLKAGRVVPALAWLEQQREATEVTPEVEERTKEVLEAVTWVVEETKKQLEKIF